MTVVNHFSPRHRSDEGEDQLDSQAATPSGIATPQPDPSDKRLPGIAHNYFGQVGPQSPTREDGGGGAAMAEEVTREGCTSGGRCMPRPALSTPPDEEGDDVESEVPRGEPCAGCKARLGYPTPPASEASKEGRSCSRERIEEHQRPPRPSLAGDYTADKRPLPRSRRHTAGIKSLSSFVSHAPHVVETSVVHASTPPNTPTRSRHVSALSALTASLETAKLTNPVASPRKKSTPPHTPHSPRALSKSNGAEISPTRSQPEVNVSAPKGKLFVQITEARGLRPSYDPYIVCVFEWNEYISKGPKEDVAQVEDTKPREDLLGGVPIKRSISDMGRSIAIPMKSRQSSTTSLTEQQKSGKTMSKQVTDPRWEQDAIL
jgi:serine/threonine protein kinase SCH9